LLVQVVKGKHNSFTDTVSNDCVDVFSVFLPFWLLLVEFNSVIDLFKKLVDGTTTVLDT
jgi:hypothetical protein